MARVAVGGIQEHPLTPTCRHQGGVGQQGGGEAHVAAVEVGGAIVWQLEQDLDGPGAVIGIDEGHLDTCGSGGGVGGGGVRRWGRVAPGALSPFICISRNLLQG